MNTRTFLASWLPIAVAGTIIFGVIYSAGQQIYRQAVNVLPIEVARNLADYLSQGVTPSLVAGSMSKVDMTKSLSLFGMVFDQSGNVQYSSGVNGTTIQQNPGRPNAPMADVFQTIPAGGERVFTWETEQGLRYATVIEQWSYAGNGTTTSGYFLAARSLALVDAQVRQLGILCLAGWLVFVIASVAAVWYGARLRK